jgi:hypothetical protein
MGLDVVISSPEHLPSASNHELISNNKKSTKNAIFFVVMPG